MRSLPARPLLLGAALVTWATPALLAQGPGLGEGRPFHALVFSTGATTMAVDALNSVLTGQRFSGLSNDGIGYGISAHGAFGRALIGADLTRTTFGEEGSSSGRTDDLNATQYLATASYALLSTGRLSIYPALGVGVGHVDVTLRERNAAPAAAANEPTFQTIAASPGAESVLSGNHLLFSLGGGADYLVTRRESSSIGVVFGMRAGMLFAPNRTTWTSGGRAVTAGPDASAGGPFVRVVVGIGGR